MIWGKNFKITKNPSDTYFYVSEHLHLFSVKKKFRYEQGGLTPTPFSFTEMTPTIRFLSFKWADWLSHSLICPHNALVSHLNLVPGFRACFLRLSLGPPPPLVVRPLHFFCVCISILKTEVTICIRNPV